MGRNTNALKIVHSQHNDVVPKFLKIDKDKEQDSELEKGIYDTTHKMKSELEMIVNQRLGTAQSSHSHSKFVKYKPSGSNERIVKMVVMAVEPLELPKLRVPKAYGSPPVLDLHSRPRPVTVKDQQDWKIPPCVLNWKNPKGFTIPLDKHCQANSRGIQDVQINDNFAKVSEALYVAEQKAREAVAMRSKVEKEMIKENEGKVEGLRGLAQRAQFQMAMESEKREGRLKREKIHMERQREREREGWERRERLLER